MLATWQENWWAPFCSLSLWYRKTPKQTEQAFLLSKTQPIRRFFLGMRFHLFQHDFHLYLLSSKNRTKALVSLRDRNTSQLYPLLLLVCNLGIRHESVHTARGGIIHMVRHQSCVIWENLCCCLFVFYRRKFLLCWSNKTRGREAEPWSNGIRVHIIYFW